MTALVQVIVTADRDDLGRTVAEQMICLNNHDFDNSNDACVRLLAWLRRSDLDPRPPDRM